MRFLPVAFAGVVVLMALPAFSVVVGNGVAAYQPQIDIVSTGIVSDMQGTVSADRKYVTINARPQQSTLLDMATFTFAGGATTQQGSGTVGTGSGNGGHVKPSPLHSAQGAHPMTGEYGAINPPMAAGTGVGAVLYQRGMTPLNANP